MKNRHLTLAEKRDWLAEIFRDASGEYSQADKFKAMAEDTRLAQLEEEKSAPPPPATNMPPAGLLDLLPPPFTPETPPPYTTETPPPFAPETPEAGEWR